MPASWNGAWSERPSRSTVNGIEPFGAHARRSGPPRSCRRLRRRRARDSASRPCRGSRPRRCRRSGSRRLFTYSLEPNSPASSPAQNAKRTGRCGWTPSFRACTASSSSVATPEPLSLIPGPLSIESRCAPRRSGAPLVAPGRSASTFAVSVSAHLEVRVHAHPDGPGVRLLGKRLAELVRERECGHLDRADERRLDRPFVPGRSVVEDDDRGCSRAGLAFRTFSAKKQPPRRMSAIAPASKSSKSEESQPLVVGIRIDRLEGRLDRRRYRSSEGRRSRRGTGR